MNARVDEFIATVIEFPAPADAFSPAELVIEKFDHWNSSTPTIPPTWCCYRDDEEGTAA